MGIKLATIVMENMSLQLLTVHYTLQEAIPVEVTKSKRGRNDLHTVIEQY